MWNTSESFSSCVKINDRRIISRRDLGNKTRNRKKKKCKNYLINF